MSHPRNYKALLEENRILREALHPRPETKGTAPLILYFGSDKDRDEFVALVQEAKPGMKSYSIPESHSHCTCGADPDSQLTCKVHGR